MANISPGTYTKIVDLSSFVQQVPGTIGFICALTEKGEDNKVKLLGSQTEFVEEFGKPNISQFGTQYSQGPYIAFNYLGESSALQFMRCLPDDATYSNIRIYGNVDTTNVYFADYVSDLNNTTDITTAMQAWGLNTPLVIFYPIGRGTYYNYLGIELSEDEKYPGEGIYHLDVYETQSNGDYVMIESFTISFDESAKSLNPGESIFLEYILETYSKVLRARVSSGGFDLLEKVFYDTRLGSAGGTRAGGPTGETGEYEYNGEISIESSGSTTYIDSTSWEDSTSWIDTTADSTAVIANITWTTTSALNEAKYSLAGCGTTTDALCFGGYTGTWYIDTTEIWNGSSWAITSNLTEDKSSLAGCGTTSDALCFGGYHVGSAFKDTTEIWNGSSWATTSSLTQSKSQFAGCGNISDALCFGGYNGTRINITEIWSGSIWATTSSLNEGKNYLAGCGNTSNALCFGGSTTISDLVNTTEIWNGSSWTTTSSLNEAKNRLAGCGTTSDALCFGGEDGTVRVDTTEMWNGSSWAITSSLNQTKYNSAGCGDVSDALCFGGYTGAKIDITEIWGVTSYSVIPIIIDVREEVLTPYVVHHQTPVITNIYQLTDTNKDFSPYETDPESGDATYVVIVSDSNNQIVWGWMGDSTGVGNITVNVWQDRDLDTGTRGWNGDTGTFTYDDDNLTYIIKKSYDQSGGGIPGLFSVRPLKKGTEGSLVYRGTFSTATADQILAQGYSGVIDENVLDRDSQYFNLIYDAGYTKNIKDQIVGLAQAREDSVAIIDIGDNPNLNTSISSRTDDYPYNTYFASLFESYNRVFDLFTERQVWFSPCYHLAYILPRNDRVGELWFAAAGNNRGVARGIEELRYVPNISQRDILYLNQINPIIHQNNSYMLWGQLTSQSKASALQDLNVVRLLLYIETALQQYSRDFVFEQNGPAIWNQVRMDVIDFLELVKKKRGLFEYTVSVGATDAEIRYKTFHVNIELYVIKIAEKVEINISMK